MVLLVAIALVGAAVGLLLVGRGNAGPYILALLAVLAMVGVFSLFALATGILRARRPRTRASPLLKAVVDEAVDGILVTDRARPRDLRQCRLSRPGRCQPTPTTCGRSSGCSSAIPTCRRRSIACSRRRAKAAALQEEVRVAGAQGQGGELAAACACGRSATRARDAQLTLWTVADVTRDRERQENIFQELQHAIDYLDHAPAGFFSVDAQRRHRLPQRHARRLARPRSRAGRLRRAEARRHRRPATAPRCSPRSPRRPAR